MIELNKIFFQNKFVTFSHATDGSLWYEHPDLSFLVPVPFEDVGIASFKKEDKSLLYMRWIRKAVKEYNDAQAHSG